MVANAKRIQSLRGANVFLYFLGALLGPLTLLATPIPARVFSPLGDGEGLTYRVSWGPIPFVGRIELHASLDAGILEVRTTTSTRGLIRAIFPFDAHGESNYSTRDGRLLSSFADSVSRIKSTSTAMVFDYPNARARYTDKLVPGNSRFLDMPPGAPQDLILGLLRTRAWNLKPGDSRMALVFFQDDFYELTIHAVGTDVIATPLGVFRTVVLEPRMETTPPKGMFRHGSTVRVWDANEDPRHLPVRFQVVLKYGSATATLSGYQPPKPDPAPAQPK